jgi:hypothetical protein
VDRGCVCHLDFLISLSARLSVSHADISAGLWQFGADVPWECPLIGVVRKWLADRQNDAIDPKRTFDLKNLWWTRSVKLGRCSSMSIVSICSDQPIQILRANKAVFMNKDAPKSPSTPAKSHFARNPKPANVTNRGNETRLNRLIETKPAGPPLSVRYGSNRTAVANSVQLARSRDHPSAKANGVPKALQR